MDGWMDEWMNGCVCVLHGHASSSELAPGMDGWMYILDNASGNLLWEFNTNADFSEYTDTKAYGGTIEGLGPVIAGNNLFINSGYQYGGNMPGNVVLNFELLD